VKSANTLQLLRWLLAKGTPIDRPPAIRLATNWDSAEYVEVAGNISEGDRVSTTATLEPSFAALSSKHKRHYVAFHLVVIGGGATSAVQKLARKLLINC
jgi:hypothetical protein